MLVLTQESKGKPHTRSDPYDAESVARISRMSGGTLPWAIHPSGWLDAKPIGNTKHARTLGFHLISKPPRQSPGYRAGWC
jgi:hypothetical protein